MTAASPLAGNSAGRAGEPESQDRVSVQTGASLPRHVDDQRRIGAAEAHDRCIHRRRQGTPLRKGHGIHSHQHLCRSHATDRAAAGQKAPHPLHAGSVLRWRWGASPTAQWMTHPLTRYKDFACGAESHWLLQHPGCSTTLAHPMARGAVPARPGMQGRAVSSRFRATVGG